ncbi:MAG TPA: hypothetical protein DCM54_09025 [Gammaproteobacteria bacterium]|nr:hypothetical protein [Gammaproteobacteria bacterium]
MNLLEETAAATSLREGAEGVRSILVAAARGGNTPLKELAQEVHMPLPVVSAVRRELEKRGVFSRNKGVCLTEHGEKIARELGVQFTETSTDDALSILRVIGEQMPDVDVTLDQAFALPETTLRRATYASEHDALAGRNIIFIGDDDLTSIAVALLLREGQRVQRLVVIDIDQRIIDLIESVSTRYSLDIECFRHDARDPLPIELQGQFYTFFTDPPYTLTGLELFLARAKEAIQPGPGKQGFLSFGHKDPDTDLGVFQNIGRFGLVPKEIIDDFNTYGGGTIIGNVSRMIRLVSGSIPVQSVPRHEESIYTGDVNPSHRIYICNSCSERNRVGGDCFHISIEALKTVGCPKCGQTKFTLAEKISKENNSE